MHRLLAPLTAAMLVVGGCGGDTTTTETKSGTTTKEVDPTAVQGVVSVPNYRFESYLMSAGSRGAVAGRRLSTKAGELVVVRVLMINRRKSSLDVAGMSASLRDRDGRRYRPVITSASATSAGAFREQRIPAGGEISSELAFDVPKARAMRSRLHVNDPIRREAFDLQIGL